MRRNCFHGPSVRGVPAAMQYDYQHPVYAREAKDIPERLRGHRWLPPVDYNKLPKHQLEVKMCCSKCEEKVLEEIWEVPGVFDVRASKVHRKVVVTAMPAPIGLDEDAVLRKARKIDRRARFVALDSSEISKIERSEKPSISRMPEGMESNTSFGYGPPPEYRWPRPPEPYDYEPAPHHDGNAPFYFLVFIIMLLSMFFFRK